MSINKKSVLWYFSGIQKCWKTRYSLVGWLHQLKASTAMDLGITIFVFPAWRVALRNLGLLIKADNKRSRSKLLSI